MSTLTGRWSGHNLPVLPYLTYNLHPILIRSSGIAFSGTVGMGIWTNTGGLISISGSAGCVLAYTVSAFIVTAVMRSLAEMVSVRPFAGALIDFPATFVDPALGFAVGVTYWYVAPCVSSAFL